MKYRVKETTKQKDNGERPQESIQTVTDNYKDRGKFHDGEIESVVILNKESDGEIKVSLKNINGKVFHIGYIQKADLKEVSSYIERKVAKADANFVVNSYDRTIGIDDNGNHIWEKAYVTEVFIRNVRIADANNLKVIGCGLFIFILFLIIIIISL